LKNYFRHNEKATPGRLGLMVYRKKKKRKVLRTGNIPGDDNGFYPDYISE
jgi:hypothetical protein